MCSRGTVKLRSGRVGNDVGLGGILVRPGDWVVGDEDESEDALSRKAGQAGVTDSTRR